MKAQLGDMVIDNHGRLGLVDEIREDLPEASWLAMQSDHRLRDGGYTEWLSILPMCGGAVRAPADLVTVVRKATLEDLRKLYHEGNPTRHGSILKFILDALDLSNDEVRRQLDLNEKFAHIL